MADSKSQKLALMKKVNSGNDHGQLNNNQLLMDVLCVGHHIQGYS